MKIIMIGAGPAAVTAAETVRTFDRQAELTLLTDEPYLPYSPPAMADHFIHGNDLHLWRPSDWPEQTGVDFRSGVRVESIEPEAHQIQLANDEQLDYDRLLIATGARLYAPLEGAGLPGIYNFKSLSAAENLVAKVRSGQASSAIIVGAGFIGMEIAPAAPRAGSESDPDRNARPGNGNHVGCGTAGIALNLMRPRRGCALNDQS
jgi:NADPH-dependent 2,4-dienoyl-CoA reductase/sulfur reductase-like enzyme